MFQKSVGVDVGAQAEQRQLQYHRTHSQRTLRPLHLPFPSNVYPQLLSTNLWNCLVGGTSLKAHGFMSMRVSKLKLWVPKQPFTKGLLLKPSLQDVLARDLRHGPFPHVLIRTSGILGWKSHLGHHVLDSSPAGEHICGSQLVTIPFIHSFIYSWDNSDQGIL